MPVSAKLAGTAYGALAPYPARTLALRPVLSSNWMERTVTWNNAPAFGAPLLTYAPSSAGRDVLDATSSLLTAWQAGQSAVDFALTVESQADNSVFYYYSREHSDATLRPGLEVDVVPAANRYPSWIAGYAGVPEHMRAEIADPDGDGVPNLLEMFLARTPAAPEAKAPLLLADGSLSFRLAGSLPASTRIVLETSHDLVTWTETTIEAAHIHALAGGERRIVVPADTSAARTFWRLHLHTQP